MTDYLFAEKVENRAEPDFEQMLPSPSMLSSLMPDPHSTPDNVGLKMPAGVIIPEAVAKGGIFLFKFKVVPIICSENKPEIFGNNAHFRPCGPIRLHGIFSLTGIIPAGLSSPGSHEWPTNDRRNALVPGAEAENNSPAPWQVVPVLFIPANRHQ